MSYSGAIALPKRTVRRLSPQKRIVTPSYVFHNRAHNRAKNGNGTRAREPHRNGSRHYRGQRLFDLTTYPELVDALTQIAEGAATCNNYGYVHGEVHEKLRLAQRYAVTGHYFKPSRIARMGPDEVRTELRKEFVAVEEASVW